MTAVRTAFRESQLSFEQLGLRMGYPREIARKSAWQFVRRTKDPRFSMLRRFAGALGIRVSELVDQEALRE